MARAIPCFLSVKHKTKQCHGNCWDGWRPPVAVRNCWWSATSTVTTARCCLYMSLTPWRAQQDHHTLPPPPSPGQGRGHKLVVGQALSPLMQLHWKTMFTCLKFTNHNAVFKSVFKGLLSKLRHQNIKRIYQVNLHEDLWLWSHDIIIFQALQL